MRSYKWDGSFYAKGILREASAFYPTLFGSGSSGLGEQNAISDEAPDEITGTDEDHLDEYVRILLNNETDRFEEALQMLAENNPSPEQVKDVAPVLWQILRDPHSGDNQRQEDAAYEILRQGNLLDEGAHVFIEIIQDPNTDDWKRYNYIRLLRVIGPAAKEAGAAPVLLEVLDETETLLKGDYHPNYLEYLQELKRMTLFILEEISPETIPEILAQEKDEDPGAFFTRVRNVFIGLLGVTALVFLLGYLVLQRHFSSRFSGG